MSTTENALATARTDLVAAEQRVTDVAAGESAASISATTYAAWRATRAGADIEVDRLKSLVTTLSASVEAETRNAAAAAQASVEATADANANAAADVIHSGLAEIDRIVVEMMSAIAQSDIEIAAAQRGRDPTLPRLTTAEQRARGGVGLPLKIISEKFVDRWVHEGDDKPLGDAQIDDIVVTHDGRRGFIQAESHRAQVVKRQFREVRYLPAVPAAFVEVLAETLSLPAICGGGAPIWSPSKFAGPHEVLQQLQAKADLAEHPDRRTPVIECTLVRDLETKITKVAAA